MKKNLVNNKPEENATKVAANEGYKVGKDIKAKCVRVIGAQGQNLGLMDLDVALEQAQDQSLDLVQIGGNDKDAQPTAKIMDFGKFLYEKKKQRNEAKKKQKVIEIKELKLRPNIGESDYMLRINRTVEFLTEGKHVKITLQFRGREIGLKETTGTALFERIVADVTSRFGSGFDMQKESKCGPLWSRIFVPKTA